MIRSMTGFGRGEFQQGTRKFCVEIRSVNHRYLDVSVKLPRRYYALEANLRRVLKEYVERGKTDVYVTYEDTAGAGASIWYDESAAAAYLEHFRQMCASLGVKDDVTASVLGACPDVFVQEEEREDAEAAWPAIEQALRTACENFVAAREREGEHLKADLIDKLDRMFVCVGEVEERYPQILAQYRQRLTDKIREALGDVALDEARINAEIVIFADKVCTDEETVRLASHIKAMRAELSGGGAVGRKLDFIAQEMNREANTILSKANDLRTSETGILLKTEIEKVREQVQNIE